MSSVTSAKVGLALSSIVRLPVPGAPCEGVDRTHGKDRMRPFASTCATDWEIHKPPQNHAATDCDCGRPGTTGICVWFS